MFFHDVNEAQPDPIFGLTSAFMADTRKEKVSLLAGIYKDEELRSELFDCAKKAEEQIRDVSADYLPIDGLSEMLELLGPIVFGDKNWKEAHGRIYAAHTTGGTGALRAGAEFLAQAALKKAYIPNQSWPNHRLVLEKAGFEVENYPYYSKEKKGFDCDAMIRFLSQLPEKTIIILHACCHNPTGCDPTFEEWRKISHVIKEKNLLPFFDFAYQGLGDDLDLDAQAVRLFLKEGHEMAIAYSCSKNFSMYCHRVGALFVVADNAAVKHRVGTQVKRIIRALYSNPSAHGARIVFQILKQKVLRDLWLRDLEMVRNRAALMRKTLIEHLSRKAKEIDFNYLKFHKGMFSFIDLNKIQVQKLIDRYAVYLTGNGRISVVGITSKNIDYVVDSIVAIYAEKN